MRKNRFLFLTIMLFGIALSGCEKSDTNLPPVTSSSSTTGQLSVFVEGTLPTDIQLRKPNQKADEITLHLTITPKDGSGQVLQKILSYSEVYRKAMSGPSDVPLPQIEVGNLRLGEQVVTLALFQGSNVLDAGTIDVIIQPGQSTPLIVAIGTIPAEVQALPEVADTEVANISLWTVDPDPVFDVALPKGKASSADENVNVFMMSENGALSPMPKPARSGEGSEATSAESDPTGLLMYVAHREKSGITVYPKKADGTLGAPLSLPETTTQTMVAADTTTGNIYAVDSVAKQIKVFSKVADQMNLSQEITITEEPSSLVLDTQSRRIYVTAAGTQGLQVYEINQGAN